MKSNRFLLPKLLLCFIMLSLSSLAQNNAYKEVSIASPTAASLGKYADIPVNYHTGIPQISIPLYAVQQGPLQLPISLSYHASGLKVMEPAGWTGAGWSLSAGGVITRTVQGTPDEKYTSGFPDQGYGHFSNYGYANYLYVPGGPTGTMQDWSAFASGNKDGEPDLFFFNFAGYSGKFYFSDDRTPVLIPEQDLKIACDYSGSGSIASFTMTTPDGVKYQFGRTAAAGDVDPVEITNPFTAQSGLSNGTALSSWYLNKITSPDNVFNIQLTYDSENYSYYTTSMFPIDGDSMTQREYRLVKNYVQGVRLKQISFANGKVDFTAGDLRTDLSSFYSPVDLLDNVNTEAKALSAVQVSNNDGYCKKFTFQYSYFEDNTSLLTGGFSIYSIQTDRKRLKLLSVQEQTCDGAVTNPPYSFDYYAEKVPRRLMFGQDHWGYYNGVVDNGRLIPTYKLSNTTINGANRDASWPAMRGGSLYKINYPTGGYTEFEFEPHRTHTSYTYSDWVDRFARSAGYDGSSDTVMSYATFSGGQYRLIFKNSINGSQGLLYIFNSSNQSVEAMVAEPGETFTKILNLPAGTYRIRLQKLVASGGSGVEAFFAEWAPIQVSQNALVGGLRIKTMTHVDGINAAPQVTNYTYELAGQSTGILYSRPTYVQVVRNDMIKNVGFWNPTTGFQPSCSFNGCVSCDGSTVMSHFKSPSSLRPMATTQGNHIGYHQVKVAQTGNGHTIYRYYGVPAWNSYKGDVAYRDVDASICDVNTPNFPVVPLQHDFMRGELNYEGHFAEGNQVIKEVTYIPVYATSPFKTPAFMVTGFKGKLLASNYELITGRKKQLTTITTDYQGSSTNSRTDIVYFESPWHYEVSRKTSLTSQGDNLESRIQYAFDIRAAACDAISDCLQPFTTGNASCQTQYNTARNACGGASLCLTNAWLNYQECLNQSRIDYINCRKTNFTNPTNAYSTCLQNAINAADSKLKPVLDLQKIFRNAPVEMANWQNSQLLNASFNEFDYETNPTGVPYPRKLQTVTLTVPSASFTSAVASGNTLTKDSRYAEEANYRHNAGNPQQMIPKNGVSNTYIWDYQNSFPIATAVNAVVDRIAYTSFEADGLGGWNLVAGATIVTTGSITGKKALNGGVTRPVPAGDYLVGVWCTGNPSVNGQVQAQTPVKVLGVWRYFEVKLTNTTTVTVSGSNIDEVRLFPDGAQMTTYTYDPLVGITSQCDATNRITYYEYDGLGRLKAVKDEDKNVLKNLDYQFQKNYNQ